MTKAKEKFDFDTDPSLFPEIWTSNGTSDNFSELIDNALEKEFNKNVYLALHDYWTTAVLANDLTVIHNDHAAISLDLQVPAQSFPCLAIDIESLVLYFEDMCDESDYSADKYRLLAESFERCILVLRRMEQRAIDASPENKEIQEKFKYCDHLVVDGELDPHEQKQTD